MENHVLNQLQNRKSIRHFTGERISEEDLSIIFQTAQRAPTSINGQQISLVYTRDKAKLTRIAKLCNEQAHIATADVCQNRADGDQVRRHHDVDLVAFQQVYVAGTVDDGNHPFCTQIFGEQAGHDIVFIIVG